MVDDEQTAAPVLGFDFSDIALGDTCLAAIVALFPEHIPEWRDVQRGDDLRMFEGPTICGHARVRWRRTTSWPVHGPDIERFVESGMYADPDEPMT